MFLCFKIVSWIGNLALILLSCMDLINYRFELWVMVFFFNLNFELGMGLFE